MQQDNAPPLSAQFASEVRDGQRFEFGKNWRRFLAALNEERIAIAEAELKLRLGLESLAGKSFLDIGSGSGLMSLAARRMGAQVQSIDYDPDSVGCTKELYNRYFPEDTSWKIEMGSALDAEYMRSLGQFDIVYSWGVLHHTGAMWDAFNLLPTAVAKHGQLFLAIYNDQGRSSHIWMYIKRAYCRLPIGFKFLVLWPAFLRLWGPTTFRDLLRGRPFETWHGYERNRGMSPWWDVIDWVGGYPFEVARPEEIFDFFKGHGFHLEQLKTCAGGIGCNEFVFRKD